MGMDIAYDGGALERERPIPNPQSPVANPQSPVANPHITL